jgi:hypothetical protein
LLAGTSIVWRSQAKEANCTYCIVLLNHGLIRALPGSNWMSESALNRFFERSAGFQKLRVRMMSIVRSAVDQSICRKPMAIPSNFGCYSCAGTVLYSGRRWLDPSDPKQRHILQVVGSAHPVSISLSHELRSSCHALSQGFQHLKQRFPRHLPGTAADFLHALDDLKIRQNVRA